jgi:uncharacterized repeat protein (TIGR01451 family)
MKIFRILSQINPLQDQRNALEYSERSLLLNLIKLSSAALIAVLFPFGQKALAAITITPKFTNIFYMDDDTSPNIRGMYIAYQITNDGTARDDVWAKINVPVFGSSANITLGQNEDGLVQLGSMAANETKTAFFYLHTTLSASTNINDSHNLMVYDTRPNQPGANIIGSTSFSFVQVEDTLEASANKVNTVVTGPNPAELGGVITITVTGETGTIGSARQMSFSPATYSEWPSNTFELFETKIVFAASGAVYDNHLSFTYPNTTSSNYTATYKFRAVNTISQSTVVSPVAEITSGNQIKHTSTGNFASFSQIQPPVNKVTLTKLASDSQLDNGGTVTYTLRLNNTGSTDVAVQEIRDTLPTTPGVVTYAGQATYNGVAIADPTISGSTLTWVGSFAIPAGTSRDLTFKATIPDTDGNYINSAIAYIGNAQIDTTLDTTNNAPASTTVKVGLPQLDYGDAPDAYGTNSTDNSGEGVGANHIIVDTLKLGTNLPDSETDAQTPLDGTGDGADEDGISTFPGLYTSTTSYSLTATVNNTTGSAANVYSWIDFDRDGKFDGDERATVSNGTISLDGSGKVPTGSNGTVTLTWNNLGGTGANIIDGNSYARIRLTTDNLTAATATTNRDSASVGNATNGEVEDYPIAIAKAYDYGDAPDIYGTDNTANNSSGDPVGANHTIISGLFLGITRPDKETNGFVDGTDNNGNATDDDDPVGTGTGNGDDEDNFTLPTLTVGATSYTIPLGNITTTNTTGQNATLHAWIDFNKNGKFDSTEYASATVNSGTSGGNPAANLTWSGINAGTAGNTYARFRLTSDSSITSATPGGAANNGEVEDYQIAIAKPYDFGDAPSSYGDAGHEIVATPTIYLGSIKPDQESSTQLGSDSGAAATGDDNDSKGDDEDAFTTLENVSTIDNYDIIVPVKNTSGGDATLYAWVDFNKNGKFEAGEFKSATVANNVPSINLNWSIPSGTTPGNTYIRFRLTSTSLTDDTGTANQDERSIGSVTNGEVEDYKVAIEPVPFLPPSTVGSCEVAITNGGFESPALTAAVATPFQVFEPGKIASYHENDVPGWTSFADSYIELWGNGNFLGVSPHEGGQFAEINAYVNGSLYQDLGTTPGSVITWQFAHRGRTGIDTMNLRIGSPGATVAQINPANGTTSFETDNTAWVLYQGTYTVPAGQTTTRFEYQAVSTAGGNNAAGNFIDTVRFGSLCDYGDAKSDYPVLKNNNGAAHVNDGVTFLGSKVRIELDGQPSTAGNGDDGVPGDADQIDDEDGVVFGSSLNAGATLSVDVIASVPGYLNAWIDFNQDNDWNDPGEIVFTDRSLNVGTNNLSFTVPTNATTGNTFTRFRFSTVQGISPTGIANNGEVEDYQIEISPPLASDPNLLLVKRITAINPGKPEKILFDNFVDDANTSNDNHPFWPDPNLYLPGAIDAGKVKPGDEVEYTVYFLSNGNANAKEVAICDVVPDHMTFVKNTYGVELGIGLGFDSTVLPTTPNLKLSNLLNDDQGEFYAPGTTPPANLCKKVNSANTLINVNGTNNDNGAIVVKIQDLPKANTPGSPTNSYGFMRFRGKVK